MMGFQVDAKADVDGVFWTDNGSDKVQRANPDGSALTDLVTTGLGRPTDIEIDPIGAKMYWNDWNTGNTERSDLDGSSREVLFGNLTGASCVISGNGKNGIALDVAAGKIYYSSSCDDREVFQVNVDGTGNTPIYSGFFPDDVVLDLSSGHLYIADGGGTAPGDIGFIERIDLDGANPVTILSTPATRKPRGLALDIGAGKIYWTESSNGGIPGPGAPWEGSVHRADLDGTNIETLVTSGDVGEDMFPWGIALDVKNSKMYWADINTGKIRRADLDGSNVEEVVTGLDSPQGLDLLPLPIFKEITSGPCASDPSIVCESDNLPGTGSFVEVIDGITNGSFEDVADACTAPFDQEAAGSGALTGWTIGGNSIDQICGYWLADEGSRSLDMSGGNAGSVTQTLTGLTPGANYEVRFALSGNPDDPGVKDLRVSVDTGDPSADYAFNSATDCGGLCIKLVNMGWTPKVFAFTANDADAVLTFTSLTATAFGPALDNVTLWEEELDEIAVAVEAPATSSIHYDFKITATTGGLTDPVVYDTVPAEWTVTHIDEEAVGPDNNGNFDENFGDDGIGVGCGGFQADLGDGDDVTVSRGGSSKKNKCSSDTGIVWEMEPDEMDMIRVDLQSRGPKKNGKYKPTFCGPLYLNYAAELMDGSTLIATSNRLVVAAVFDLDGGGIDPTGRGDEDGDGASDIDEVRDLGTDPCDEDTDGDGVLDGVDLCPLQGTEVTGFVDPDGCPIIF